MANGPKTSASQKERKSRPLTRSTTAAQEPKGQVMVEPRTSQARLQWHLAHQVDELVPVSTVCDANGAAVADEALAARDLGAV